MAPQEAERPGRAYGAIIAYGALISLGLALFISPFASALPDGLEKVLGLAGRSGKAALAAPMPEYAMPGIRWGVLATSLAGAAGTIVVFLLAWLLARVLVPRNSDATRLS